MTILDWYFLNNAQTLISSHLLEIYNTNIVYSLIFNI